MNVIIRNIPNTITCLNIISGCVALALACRGEQQIGSLTALQWAYIAVAVAAVADFCDGMSARLLKAYSNLGKELDSLCDLVSFGVAPAMMVYQTMLTSPVTEKWAWVALFIPVCGALRLARFNIDDSQATTFVGLPIPAGAILWIGFTALLTPDAAIMGVGGAVATVVIGSWLMVSPLRMFSLKFHSLGWKENRVRYLLAVIAVLSIVLMGLPGLLWLIVAYVLLSRLPMAYSDASK